MLEEYDVNDTQNPGLFRYFIHGELFPSPLVMVDKTNLGDLPNNEDEILYYLKNALGSTAALARINGGESLSSPLSSGTRTIRTAERLFY